MQASTLAEVAPYYKLLEIFLYGTFKDYQGKIERHENTSNVY